MYLHFILISYQHFLNSKITENCQYFCLLLLLGLLALSLSSDLVTICPPHRTPGPATVPRVSQPQLLTWV